MESKFLEIYRAATRPTVTLAFCGAFIYGFITKLVNAEVFVGVAILVIKYWFDTREPEKNGGQK